MRRAARRAICAGVIAAAVGIAIAAVPPPPVLQANPEVRVLHVNAPSPASGTIALVNTSPDSSVTVASITRDPSCDPEVTHALTTPATIPLGGSANVALQCAGSITSGLRRCMFHANSSTGAVLADFEGVCEGGNAASLVATPDPVAFGPVTVGAGASATVSLVNTAPTTITKLSLHTTDLDGTFDLGAPCNPDARECDVTIPSVMNGGATPITVWCRPKSVGVHTAKLFVATNTNQYLSPGITLTCEGTSATTPVLALTGDPVDAGSVDVGSGSSTPSSLRIRNAGTGTLQITNVQIFDGGNGAAADWNYIASGECTGMIQSICQLAPEERIDLALSFDPSAIGVRRATLVIDYFDTAARSRSVPLFGTGLGGTLSLVDAPITLDFGTVPLNISSELVFELANTGNRSITAMLSAGIGPPFSLVPAASIVVQPGIPAQVTASCRPTSLGEITTTFNAMASDAIASQPIEIFARCSGTTSTLYTNPSGVFVGQLRAGASMKMVPITVLTASGGPLQIVAASFATPTTTMTATVTPPGTTPATINLAIDPAQEGVIANELVISTTNGATVRVPISGTVATAAYQEPLARSLGTFCVNQPTTADSLTFSSTGTATIELDAPVMKLGAMSPFDLEPQTPTTYPTRLAPDSQAVIEVTPRRQSNAGVQQDDIEWTTDVEGAETVLTRISARFVDDGGALAPDALTFGPAPIHLLQANAQSVTLQNCDTQTIVFADPQVPAPFRIDSANFPRSLAPNESATFTVGFHPTRVGVFSDMLVITSQQLDDPLVVTLSGEGSRPAPPPDAGVDPPGVDERSFYGCSCASSSSPSGGLVVLLAFGFALRRRRRA